MIRRFCDACNGEIQQTANRSLFHKTFSPETQRSTKVVVDVMVSINGTTNGGEICVPCIQETIIEGNIDNRTTR
jgi:hypothetical protein